jgi:hypothetical protein
LLLSRFKKTAQAVLARLEPLLPLIHVKLLKKEVASHAASPEPCREPIRSRFSSPASPSAMTYGASLWNPMS